MRLIDADALMSQAFSTRQGYDAVLVEDIVNAPTVDALPTVAEMRKISEMCKNGKCDSCPYLNKSIKKCRFVHGADYWDFGGAENG